MLGHDWYHDRRNRIRRCERCDEEEEYHVEETHSDENAEKGEVRYRIEDGRLRIESYQVTGWSKDTEYWQWFPGGGGPLEDKHIQQLKDAIEEYEY